MMKRAPTWTAPLIITLLAILGLWIPRYFINTSQPTLILTITLFAVLWYTWETRSMQKSVRDQAEAASQQLVEITKQTQAANEQTKTAALQTKEVMEQTH